MKVSSTNLRIKDAPDRSTAEDFSLYFSAIKPGIAADIKFGGSGSCPNLPRVSTKGPGPNGRKITGVTYRYGANQLVFNAAPGTVMCDNMSYVFVFISIATSNMVATALAKGVIFSSDPRCLCGG